MNIAVNQQLDLLAGAGSEPLLENAVAQMASAGEKDRGAVFTRPEVVDFILDLIGYLPQKKLHERRLLEPSFGQGEFLTAAVARLIKSWKTHRGKCADPVAELSGALKAVELHQASIATTRKTLNKQLNDAGFSTLERDALLDAWLVQGDFLLAGFNDTKFDYVVGNPPYVRQESIPEILLAEYRRRFRTLYDRADLYIPFFERALDLLSSGGQLGFICSDRWVKNKYGGPLRDKIASDFHLKIYVDMVDTPAFSSDVIAYPAITVIERGTTGETRVAVRPSIERQALNTLATALRKGAPTSAFSISPKPVTGAPWVMEANPELALVRRLEARFPALEAVGCKVGIGVATGADKVESAHHIFFAKSKKYHPTCAAGIFTLSATS